LGLRIVTHQPHYSKLMTIVKGIVLRNWGWKPMDKIDKTQLFNVARYGFVLILIVFS